MKSVKNALFSLFFITFSLPVFSQTSICNSVFNFLKSNKCSPKTQEIISSNINQFPYIISVDFPTNNTSKSQRSLDKKNLYIIFSQEEVLNNKPIFENIISFMKNNSFNFNIELIFLYGENQLIEKDTTVYSLNEFIKTLNTNEDSTAIFVNLNNSVTSIISTSNGISAPSWLIKNEHDIFSKYNIKSGLPFYYISQLYSYSFIKNRQLDSFFNINIPGIILNFDSQSIQKSPQLISDIVTESINAFSTTTEKVWDQHFLMINIMGKYRLISELNIVHTIIIIIFCFLLFISLLSFINSNFQRKAWSKIVKIWYVVPITFAIIVFSLFLGKGITALFAKHLSHSASLYFLCCSQLIIAFCFVSVYYIIQIISNNKYEAHSIDFMIIITIFINQFIFLFIDISLFPLFMFGCILAIFALAIKNNFFHIAIFLITFIPFGLYAHTLVKTSNIWGLFNYLYSHHYPIIFISLVLYPAFLIYFRILTAFNEKSSTKKSLYISCGTTVGIVVIISLTIGIVRTNQIKKINYTSDKTLIQTNSDIQISYSDKNVFDDVIRTLKIKIPNQCIQCNVNIFSEEGTPILYSSDDYELVNTNSANFLIPYCPPNSLSFSYGTELKPTTITVSAIFQNNLNNLNNLNKDEFSICTKSITINEDGK